ncbi:polyribonucleotide nucleotidyltransferase [Neorickettsia sennetsu]|uniref:Polyribonucleotide nucleotidyltransferase n=1 Tax=Ehrlichia sennetsu (strain ATCC VR-367 / Miyayama) TaxID=222891 RepID=PNP_EHRS3|nr:polyribonucleotide nucleotidyltransferase [Neorickettsia sennetsu]Q2GEY8.1 RecName: Full=Polyribonucleotide nucleotidyltransferase; AltName: Full=Polynucleotide phosphorylase; Short=PNPase [Neorickettsia sennetsu str. Miyayama]ABD46123.1 polyribonucleotide nucleotidyltransferase [Neorickettsia sennetsu str. Miyayama]
MFEIKESSMEWEGKSLHIKTGEVARQAAGAACVSYGGTVVLAVVTLQKDTAASKKTSDLSGLALVTNFLAKSYALGRIPNGFFKREGKLSEREVLASRVVDRAVRPLIEENLVNEVNIVCKLLAHGNRKVLPEIPALIAASAALQLSGIPFSGPVIGVDVDMRGSEVTCNEIRETEGGLELFVACTEESVVMVEAEASEASEEEVVNALSEALKSAKPVFSFINEFVKSVTTVKPIGVLYDNKELCEKVRAACSGQLESVYNERISSKEKRHNKLGQIYTDTFAQLSDDGYAESEVLFFIKKLEKEIVRKNVLEEGIRPDGRSLTEIRPISIALDYLPGTHGSALFTRGGTQSLVVATLGSYQDEQVMDDIDGERRESVLLHYNFLPYAVGEVGALRAPGRREIGHGRLALKAVKAVLPGKEVFPYTLRLVSEITESDGSSSMATVCGSSLALMDTGVPITKHVAGIAMGLITDGVRSAVLSDISGDEDMLGDMDFKVAGTRNGIVALQMDMKVRGISIATIRDALNQALAGRLHILEKMEHVIAKPRESLKDSAPKILCYKIDKDVVHKVIGSGGKTIRGISSDTSAKIDIDQNNYVYIMADTEEALMEAKTRVDMASGASDSNVPQLKIGELYDGKIVSVVDFGLFVVLPNKQEGLVHISEISKNRVNDIRADYTEGQAVTVRIKDIGSDGKIKLTMRIDEDRVGSGGSSSSPKKRFGAHPRKNGKDNRSNNSERGFNERSGSAEGSSISRKRFF